MQLPLRKDICHTGQLEKKNWKTFAVNLVPIFGFVFSFGRNLNYLFLFCFVSFYLFFFFIHGCCDVEVLVA